MAWMRPLLLRFAFAVAVVAPLVAAAIGSGCGPGGIELRICLNPETGKIDTSIYDSTNFVNGEPDPCHCYDPCGPAKTCPVEVDAGMVPDGCDAAP